MDDKGIQSFNEASKNVENFYANNDLRDRAIEAVMNYMMIGMAQQKGLKIFSKKHKEILKSNTFVHDFEEYFRVFAVQGDLPKNIGTDMGRRLLAASSAVALFKKIGHMYMAFPIINTNATAFTNHFFDRYNQRFAKTSYSRKDVIKTFLRNDFLSAITVIEKADEDGFSECRVGYKTGIGLGFKKDGVVIMITYVDDDNMSELNQKIKAEIESRRKLIMSIKHDQAYDALTSKFRSNIAEEECDCPNCIRLRKEEAQTQEAQD